MDNYVISTGVGFCESCPRLGWLSVYDEANSDEFCIDPLEDIDLRVILPWRLVGGGVLLVIYGVKWRR